MIFMAEKKKTTKAKSTKKANSLLPVKEKKAEKKEEVYSFQELAEIFGISVMKTRAYFNMSQLDYSEKITIKQARELFNKF